jgi:hypothetical protein
MRRAVAVENQLVWIFGSPRSGSTWLLRLLTHPLAPDEEAPHGVARVPAAEADPPAAIPINEPYAQQHLAPAVSEEWLASGRLTVPTLHELRRGAPNYFLSDRYTDAWRPHLRRLVLDRLAAQARAIGREHGLRGSPPVIVKEPNGSIGADFVMSLLRRSRLIFLLRDGRDVVDSMIDAQMPGGWLSSPDSERSQRLELVERESRLWVARTQAVKRAFDAHPPELRRLVRYEEARAEPAAVLAELEQWLGLRRTEAGRRDALRWNDFDSVPAESKGPGKPLRAASPGLWRQNLDEREQLAMHQIMQGELAQLGYVV